MNGNIRKIRTLLLGLWWLCLCGGVSADVWQSTLFPPDWQPGVKDDAGRFLHDFSYAGYHQGEVPLPVVSGPIFDVVKDFGADNSGQKDAGPSIQAAIDAAAAAKGGVVYLPEGDYLCEGGLKIGKNGIVLRGAGVGRSRVLFADYASKKRVNILISGFVAPKLEMPLVADAAQWSRMVEVEDASDFAVGDDVDLGWVITDEFVAAHGMTGVWKVHNGKWVAFFRANVQAVDTEATPHRIELDVPLRYAVKVRDGALVKKRTHYIEECGVEDLSIANPMLTGTVESYERSVRRQLILMLDAKNCWVKNVSTFLPTGSKFDAKHHLYSSGIAVTRSKRITVANCTVQSAQRRDAGGHGYLFEVLGANDILFEGCSGIDGRHNYSSNWQFGNVGNVFLRCLSRGGALSDWDNNLGPCDFHHSLAMATLIDSCVIDDGWHALNRGGMSGGAGHTATESVFWNCRGNGEILSAQYGWGYLIGLTNTLQVTTEVDLENPNWIGKQFLGTLPFDYVEGRGQGERLEPQSLYEAQVKYRLEGAPAFVSTEKPATATEARALDAGQDSHPTIEPQLVEPWPWPELLVVLFVVVAAVVAAKRMISRP